MAFDTAIPASSLASRWRRHPRVILAAVAVLLFLPLFAARLWLIDDHEILRILTSFRDASWPGVWQFLQSVDFGDSPRFRPLYYLVRVLESFAFRDAAPLWFAVRCALALAFVLALWRFAGAFLAPWAAFGLAVGALAMPYVPDAFMRLGPQESYAAGLCALLLGALLRPGGPAWLLASLAATLLVCTKENFLFLLPFQAVPLVLAWRARAWRSFAAGSVLLAVSLTVALVIAIKLVGTHGVDFYGNSVQGERLVQAVHSLAATPGGWASIALVVLAALVWESERRRGRLAGPALGLVPLALACLGFNIVFYSGVPDPYMRYAFPYWVVAATLGAYVVKVLGTGFWPARYASGTSGAIAASIAVALALGLARNGERAVAYALCTWTVNERVAALAATDPRTPIVVHAQEVRDFEPAGSVARFLDYYQTPASPRFLDLPAQAFGASSFDKYLYGLLARQKREGGEGFRPWPVAAPVAGACVEAYFRLETPPRCSRRVFIEY